MRSRHANGTQSVYSSAVLSYARFAAFFRLHGPFPATDEHLTPFLAFQSQSCKPSTLKNYVYAIRDHHLANGMQFAPTRERFQLVSAMQGLKRLYGEPANKKLAITRRMLWEMSDVRTAYSAAKGLSEAQESGVWAAISVAFAGMLRKDNVSVGKSAAFNTREHLCRSDVAFGTDNQGCSLMWINCRHSKTNNFHVRTHLIAIYAIGGAICPVAAVQRHFALVAAGQSNAAFSFPSKGRRGVRGGTTPAPLQHSVLVRHLKGLLSATGRDPSVFSGHSLRRGGATLAFRMGLPLELIMQHGDWASMVVLEYRQLSTADRQRLPQEFARILAYRP